MNDLKVLYDTEKLLKAERIIPGALPGVAPEAPLHSGRKFRPSREDPRVGSHLLTSWFSLLPENNQGRNIAGGVKTPGPNPNEPRLVFIEPGVSLPTHCPLCKDYIIEESIGGSIFYRCQSCGCNLVLKRGVLT